MIFLDEVFGFWVCKYIFDVLSDWWMVVRLKLLPKKGDLSLSKNWRGICLLNIDSKIVSCVLVDRLQVVQEKEGLEEQAGFRSARGTIDGIYNTSLELQKRKEHNLETWALFINLVNIFDTVSRKCLFAVMQKFGMPNHFINLVIRLHTKVSIKVKIGTADDVEVKSTIGVRQVRYE